MQLNITCLLGSPSRRVWPSRCCMGQSVKRRQPLTSKIASLVSLQFRASCKGLLPCDTLPAHNLNSCVAMRSAWKAAVHTLSRLMLISRKELMLCLSCDVPTFFRHPQDTSKQYCCKASLHDANWHDEDCIPAPPFACLHPCQTVLIRHAQ